MHRAWAGEIERRWPGSLRLFAPSETQAARAAAGIAAVQDRRSRLRGVGLAVAPGRRAPGRARRRRGDAGCGRVIAASSSMRARCSQQRLHDQLNALCPGLSAPPGHGRALEARRRRPGQAVLACAVAFAGRAPSNALAAGARAGPLERRRPPRSGPSRWKRLLDAASRRRAARRSAWAAISSAGSTCGDDIALADDQLSELLAQTAGQILTTLPGVAAVRATAFAAYTLPIERWPTPEHLYSATGLAPASYQSARRSRAAAAISRQGLPEHRDALMAHRLGPVASTARLPAPATPNSAPAASGRSRPASRSRATPAGSAGDCLTPNSPTTISVTISARQARAVTAFTAMPHDGAT